MSQFYFKVNLHIIPEAKAGKTPDIPVLKNFFTAKTIYQIQIYEHANGEFCRVGLLSLPFDSERGFLRNEAALFLKTSIVTLGVLYRIIDTEDMPIPVSRHLKEIAEICEPLIELPEIEVTKYIFMSWEKIKELQDFYNSNAGKLLRSADKNLAIREIVNKPTFCMN